MKQLIDILEENPIIAAIKNEDQLKKVLETDIKIVFVLYGNILNLSEISKRIEEANKIPLLHIDLVEGMTAQTSSLIFIKQNTYFKGIISTKVQTLSKAKRIGFYTILRTFLLDSLSMYTLINHNGDQYDAIEILPGLLFKTIKELTKSMEKPIITGGLISEKSEVLEAIKSGATCISTTDEKIWLM